MSDHPTTHRLSLERVEHAARVIDPVFLRTPQFVCEPLGEELGVRLGLKVETLNPIRSFEGRGADLLVSQIPSGAPLVCASAGNFGQAMAYACRKRGVPLTVYAGTAANPLKVERICGRSERTWSCAARTSTRPRPGGRPRNRGTGSRRTDSTSRRSRGLVPHPTWIDG